MKDWKGQRVLIIGAARQGLALARFLAKAGAVVTLNDKRSATELSQPMAALADLPIRWVLGEHPLDLLDTTDLVGVSGGVPLGLPLIQAALEHCIPLTNDSQIFMDSVPCPVIGITGSAGKTTTTTLVGRMAEAAVQPPSRVWVGGNIGRPLVDELDNIRSTDLVVLELSSFQLELMTTSPFIAAITNITPNHLDRHGTFEAYSAAKARLIQFQSEGDTAVMNRADPASQELLPLVQGRLVTFGISSPEPGQPGSYLEGEQICLTDGESVQAVMDTAEIRLRGEHNRLNVLAACAIAFAAGFPVEAMRHGVEDFSGVPHRLEFVRRFRGADWYNDSIATAPERTLAAIQSFDEPLVLLLGGRDKNLPWESLIDRIRRRVDHVVLFGEAASMIEAIIGQPTPGQRLVSVSTTADLEEAVRTAAEVAAPGDVVLLSPGGTSYDEFIDFEMRGERFRQWVNQLS